jgi:hypothetical protein
MQVIQTLLLHLPTTNAVVLLFAYSTVVSTSAHLKCNPAAHPSSAEVAPHTAASPHATVKGTVLGDH